MDVQPANEPSIVETFQLSEQDFEKLDTEMPLEGPHNSIGAETNNIAQETEIVID
jgi:hypothetical protein